MKEPKKAKILPIRALKLGPTQFQTEVERLQAEGRMPSLPELLDVIAEVRAEYRGKILHSEGGKQEEEVVNNEFMEPCRRPSGAYRAHFPSKEAAEAFAADPANTDYHGDLAHKCGKCGSWHLSRVEWLVPDFARRMRSVN